LENDNGRRTKFYTDRLTNAGTSITTHGFISFTNSRLLANSSSADEFIDNLNNLKRRIGDELGELKKDARYLISGDNPDPRWRRAYANGWDNIDGNGKVGIYFSDDGKKLVRQGSFDQIPGSGFDAPEPNRRGQPIIGSQTGDNRTNAEILRRRLEGSREFPSNPTDEAHHIVESIDERSHKTRLILDRFEIDINDPVNGVYLTPSIHRRIHTDSYRAIIYERLSEAETPQEAIATLAQFKQDILSGKIR